MLKKGQYKFVSSFEMFELKDDFNLLFIQYCFSILPIDYALKV